ncbi:Vacuolar protein-sorting-associated protein 33, partial [Linderina macrospora]
LAYLDKLLALADPHAPVPGCNGELKDSPPTTAPNSIHKVLRLMCLYSLWRGPSFKQKVYDAWYEELVDAFGHHQTITLDNLEAVGLLVSPANNTGGTSASTAKPSMLKLAAGGDVNSVGILNSIVPSTKPRNPVHSNPLSFLRKTLNLINSDVRENDPDDISYVYSGYAPLSVRLLQCLVRDPAVYTSSSTASRYASLLRGGSSSDTTRPAQKDLQSGGVKSGWKGWEDVLAELPGETVDVTQWNDREGDLLSSDSVVQRLGEKAPATLVLFLGGCTFTEIAALRLLSQQHNHRYIAATTQIINGNSFIDSLILKASN